MPRYTYSSEDPDVRPSVTTPSCPDHGGLFSDPRARTGDPETSHLAAHSMQGRPADAQRYAIVMTLSRVYPEGMTADELDARMGWRTGTAGRRLGELVGVHWVRRLDKTRPTASGRQATIHFLAEAGFCAIEEDDCPFMHDNDEER